MPRLPLDPFPHVLVRLYDESVHGLVSEVAEVLLQLHRQRRRPQRLHHRRLLRRRGRRRRPPPPLLRQHRGVGAAIAAAITAAPAATAAKTQSMHLLLLRIDRRRELRGRTSSRRMR